MNNPDSIEANKPGRPVTPNRQGLYSKAAKHATAAIDLLVKLLQSPNDNIRLGAAKALLDKCLPDIKAVDIIGKENIEPIQVVIVEDHGEKMPTN